MSNPDSGSRSARARGTGRSGRSEMSRGDNADSSPAARSAAGAPACPGSRPMPSNGTPISRTIIFVLPGSPFCLLPSPLTRGLTNAASPGSTRRARTQPHRLARAHAPLSSTTQTAAARERSVPCQSLVRSLRDKRRGPKPPRPRAAFLLRRTGARRAGTLPRLSSPLRASPCCARETTFRKGMTDSPTMQTAIHPVESKRPERDLRRVLGRHASCLNRN